MERVTVVKGIAKITYRYEVNGHEVTVWRQHVGTAYARNGNAHNPTEYFIWASAVDGEWVLSHMDRRATAYEYARARILGIDYYDHPNHPTRARNVRSWHVVQDEMRANYRGQTREKEATQ
jgi:hypothetical protein